ncbi:transcription factor [Ganoderma sinense ZZ0214-1]|uniref:Transcription factor n=1 Tax=Ganoderma sinense ZZ0214-1 TaxID=1077348 RepID=A0A2G8SC15_9APHY|nr:transcription factor [Ganoderma sinense ZZ0214-1]
MPPVKSSDKGSPESDPPKQRKRPGRVPVSCAECRRLKLRCDRKVPCETCTKRGCAALCPEGSLITGGKGTRQAVADVEELKKKLEQMETRSNALETALRTLQATVSDIPHPLLQENAGPPGAHFSASPSADTPASSGGSGSQQGPMMSDEEDVLDAFGTLTLGLRGETRFFGQTSRSEYLIHAPERSTINENVRFPRLSKELVKEANLELDIPCRSKEIGIEMMKLLPPLSQACQMCETFLEYGRYVWYPLPRNYIFDDVVSLVYSSWRDSSECNIGSTHLLALMWMIYALSTLFDVNTPPYAIEAHEYYLLSRLSLRFAPPAHDTTLTSIQTMIYMSQYLEMSDCEPAHTQSHKAWMTMGHAVKMGHSVCFHMSSSRWRLSDSAALQRHRVFWQLFFQDTWLSFGFGRPPSINVAFVDCEMPMEPEVFSKEQDLREVGYHIWTWQYTKLLHSIMTTAFAAKPPSYAKIMELDRRVRDFPIPESLRVRCGVEEDPAPTTALVMQRVLGTLLKETSLLNLHRPYFCQALNDMPQDPLRHRYGPSVMAIYRSAWRIFAAARIAYRRAPTIAARMGVLWSYALAGSIVMCLLVIRAPTTNLATSSLTELDEMCSLFEEAASQSQIASNSLNAMKKLQKQAHDALNKMHAAEEIAGIRTELERLGGKTHFIRLSNPPEKPHCRDMEDVECSDAAPPDSDGHARSPPHAGPSAIANPIPQASGAAGTCEPPLQPDMIHPTIMEDMQRFDMDGFDGSGDTGFIMDLPPKMFDPRQAVDFAAFPELDFSVGLAMPGVGGPADVWMNGAGDLGMLQGVNGVNDNSVHVNGANGVHANGANGVNGVNGVHGVSGVDGLGGVNGHGGPSNPMGGIDMSASGPPVLDATWQALVEQLGF